MIKSSNKLLSLCLGIALVSSTVFLTNCKKDKKTEDEPTVVTPPPTNTEKLTGKNFKMTAMTVSPGLPVGPITITDLYAQMPACSKDDLFSFSTPNVFKVDEGGSKCDPNDPQTTTGTWVWSSDEKVLTITQDGEVMSLTIITNDGTTLKGSYSEVDSGITYTITVTWTKA